MECVGDILAGAGLSLRGFYAPPDELYRPAGERAGGSRCGAVDAHYDPAFKRKRRAVGFRRNRGVDDCGRERVSGLIALESLNRCQLEPPRGEGLLRAADYLQSVVGLHGQWWD